MIPKKRKALCGSGEWHWRGKKPAELPVSAAVGTRWTERSAERFSISAECGVNRWCGWLKRCENGAFSGGYELQKEPQTKQQQDNHRHIVACDFDMELGLPFLGAWWPWWHKLYKFHGFCCEDVWSRHCILYPSLTCRAVTSYPHSKRNKKWRWVAQLWCRRLMFKDFGNLGSFRKINCFAFTLKPIDHLHQHCPWGLWLADMIIVNERLLPELAWLGAWRDSDSGDRPPFLCPNYGKICLQQPWLRGLDKNPKPKRGCKDPFSPQHRQVTPLSFQQCKVKVYIRMYIFLPTKRNPPFL